MEKVNNLSTQGGVLEKMLSCIKSPSKFVIYLHNKGIIFLSDKAYLKILYKKHFNRKLNIKNPKTYTLDEIKKELDI